MRGRINAAKGRTKNDRCSASSVSGPPCSPSVGREGVHLLWWAFLPGNGHRRSGGPSFLPLGRMGCVSRARRLPSWTLSRSVHASRLCRFPPRATTSRVRAPRLRRLSPGTTTRRVHASRVRRLSSGTTTRRVHASRVRRLSSGTTTRRVNSSRMRRLSPGTTGSRKSASRTCRLSPWTAAGGMPPNSVPCVGSVSPYSDRLLSSARIPPLRR
jgi:hypothetical protein